MSILPSIFLTLPNEASTEALASYYKSYDRKERVVKRGEKVQNILQALHNS